MTTDLIEKDGEDWRLKKTFIGDDRVNNCVGVRVRVRVIQKGAGVTLSWCQGQGEGDTERSWRHIKCPPLKSATCQPSEPDVPRWKCAEALGLECIPCNGM